MYNKRFKNRTEAGQLLAEKLKQYQNSEAIVLAIPRGGVPIGYEIAKKLHLPLDLLLSKKIGHPKNKEYAIGAVTADSAIVEKHYEVPDTYLIEEIEKLQKSLQEKYPLYRGNHLPMDLTDKIVIIADDGIATGHTLLASLELLRQKKPAKIIVAVPVLPEDTIALFQKNTEGLAFLVSTPFFRSVSEFYEEFGAVTDQEVIAILNSHKTTEYDFKPQKTKEDGKIRL